MSFRDWFDHGGRRYQNTADLSYHVHVQDPAELRLNEVARRDNDAARSIEEAQRLIANLTEYRVALAARYAQLATTPYTLRLELVREARWNDKKRYWVRIVRHYLDGTEEKELEEQYPGTERHAAFSRFAALKKAHPGIETHQDTEKRPWEH